MNKPIRTYLIITFILTWSIILLSYWLYRNGIISLNQLNLVYNFGALGPFLSSLICSRYFYGKRGVKKLVSKFNFRGFNKRSTCIALSPLFLCAIGVLAYPLLTGRFFSFSETQRQFHLTNSISYVNWLLPFITYSFFEEFGWRGFLLPRLQNNFSAYKATIILTVFWASWHLPFFLWRFQFSWFIGFGFFFSLFVGSLIITSLYNFSKGSIIPVILFHFMNNIASALDKEYIVAVVSTGFIFIAIYIMKKYKPENLADVMRIKEA